MPLALLSHIVLACLLGAAACCAFEVDTSPQPDTHPPLSPADGEDATTNPPAMVWRVDTRAATYTLEMSRDPRFAGEVIRVESIGLPFYNHSAVLAEGEWHWRYRVVTKEGEVSDPGPARRFRVTPASVPLPVPTTRDLLARTPRHPRIYVNPATLDAFRARRLGPAKDAWEALKWSADRILATPLPELKLDPFPEKPGTKRGQAFYLKDGKPFVPAGYSAGRAAADAGKARTLALAYVVSGDRAYAEAARQWLRLVSGVRVDYHLENRSEHDTVVYCFEYGLRDMAVAFDLVYDVLDEAERRQVLNAVGYHGSNAYDWLRRRLSIHLNYQNSHGQQCMHALLTTALAVATDLPEAAVWTDYLVRQYANRLPWGEDDGGYTEGQTYSHKLQFILDGLYAMKTATGIDVFTTPRMRNTGAFWLHCMSLNYWWNHWGDCYALLMPMVGNPADAYISGFLAALTGDPYVKWWSDAVYSNPDHIPLRYLSDTGLRPRPPVDIPQARLFPQVGQLAAYDRFYDHHGNRILFRSSRWGSHSHAHCDQNGFVLHANGEILACDAGHYSYYGDAYHRKYSMSSLAHNTLLVDGASQPKSITARGDVTDFLNTPEACLFIGAAAGAYPERLTTFNRAILFLRPDLFVVYDELAAPQPSAYTWLLNTFEPAEIDAAKRSLTVRQRDTRLLVRHLLPEGLEYAQSNERTEPLRWRHTEKFPQQWNIQVTTAAKSADERFLALMHPYTEGAGPRVAGATTISTPGAVGLSFETGGEATTVLFQRRLDQPAPVEVASLATDARVLSVTRAGGKPIRWLAHAARRVSVDGALLFQADVPCDAAVNERTPAGAAQITLRPSAAARVRLKLGRAPTTIWAAPPSRPAEGRRLAFAVEGDDVVLSLPAEEVVLWLDPARDPAAAPPTGELRVRDRGGEYAVPLGSAVADNGEIVWYARLDPREPGRYRVTASRGGTEILAQDRWDPVVGARGQGSAEGVLRDGTEVFARFAPGGGVPTLRAELREGFGGRVVNLLRNGNFEEGILAYPPRGWTVDHPRTGDLGWPEWCREGAAEGQACLRLTRPKDRIGAVSQPMRVATAGRHVLSFRARAVGESASVTLVSAGRPGVNVKLPVAPAAAWQEYRQEVEIAPGYYTVECAIAAGGAPDQELWVDDVQFGRIAP